MVFVEPARQIENSWRVRNDHIESPELGIAHKPGASRLSSSGFTLRDWTLPYTLSALITDEVMMRIPGPIDQIRNRQNISDGTMNRQRSRNPGPLLDNTLFEDTLYQNTLPQNTLSQNTLPQNALNIGTQAPTLPWYLQPKAIPILRKGIISKGKTRRDFDGDIQFAVTYDPRAKKVTVDVYIEFEFIVQSNLVPVRNYGVTKPGPDYFTMKEVRDEWDNAEKLEFKKEFFKCINDIWSDSFIVFHKTLGLEADVHINLVDLNYPSASPQKWVYAYKGWNHRAWCRGNVEMHIWKDNIADYADHEFGHLMMIGDEYPDLEKGKRAGDKAKHSWLTEKYLNRANIVDADKDSVMHYGDVLRPRHGVIFAWALHQMTKYQGWSVRLK